MTDRRRERGTTSAGGPPRSPTRESILVLSGEGPVYRKAEYFQDSLLDREKLVTTSLAGPTDFSIFDLSIDGRADAPLFRPKRGYVPHLTSFALDFILARTGWDYELLDLAHVWAEDREPAATPGVVFLSTTFIFNRQLLRRATDWIVERFTDVPLVLGGQYSNLKYRGILGSFPCVDVVIRGDGEAAIPEILEMFRGKRAPSEVSNLVWRNEAGETVVNPLRYVDLEEYPSPQFGDRQYDVVPYESMRGCPFVCRFCSFPHASPEWRYKSARKIASDWRDYAAVNGAKHIRAMDSTFLTPRPRLLELLGLLDDPGFTWEAYARANSVQEMETVDRLASAGCAKLSIGFESMSPVTLGLMKKKVSADHNRRAVEVLRDSAVRYRGSFMVGYPGETPEEYHRTLDYLSHGYNGHFMLSVFSLNDETMPVWEDRDRLQISIDDPDDPDAGWQHVGMTSDTAHALHKRTLDEVRRSDDGGVVLLWQSDYHTPLLPEETPSDNLRIEKLIERLAMVPIETRNERDRRAAVRELLAELETYGIRPAESRPRAHPLIGATT